MPRKVLTEETLQEIIRRVVEVAHPERIILFGSAARGEMDFNSDVDLLVIKVDSLITVVLSGTST